MKAWGWMLLSVLAMTAGAVEGQQDPANPWPDHEPPPGFRCRPARNEQERTSVIEACTCLGGMLDPICSTKEENAQRQNSGKCKAWCRLDQCDCGTQCVDSAIRRPMWQTVKDWLVAHVPGWA